MIVRSYQRIFRPSRRIYQVEGHQIPVPGGVPLAWLAVFTIALLAVMMLTAGSLALCVLLAAAAGLYGLAVGGRIGALVAGAGVLIGTLLLGVALGLLDWPLRLLVVPGAVATFATLATPDGRPVHRYVQSWLLVRLRPSRRSLGRPLAPAGHQHLHPIAVWIAVDHHTATVRRGRITGPAVVLCRIPVTITTRPGGRTRVVRPARGTRGGTVPVDDLVIGIGERLEARP